MTACILAFPKPWLRPGARVCFLHRRAPLTGTVEPALPKLPGLVPVRADSPAGYAGVCILARPEDLAPCEPRTPARAKGGALPPLATAHAPDFPVAARPAAAPGEAARPQGIF